MATIGTIAVNLTANTQQLSGGLQNASTQLRTFEKDAQRTGGISAGAAAGILELSRGVEDFAVGFQTNGLQGALRGSLNNIAAFATLVGGPLAGAVAGFAAVGLSSLVSYFSRTTTSANEAKKAIDGFNDSIKYFNSLQVEAVRSRQTLDSIQTSQQAEQRIKQLQNELEVNQTQFSGVVAMSDSDEALRRRIELTNESRQIERDIEATKRRQAELAAKEKQTAEDTLAIREHQAEIEKNRKDAERGQGIVMQQMQAVSGPLFEEFQKSLRIRELQSMNLPPEIQDRIAGFIGGAFGGPQDVTQSPSMIRAGSQQAALLQQQDEARARQQEQQREMIDELIGIHEELEKIRQQNTPVKPDSVNLD